MCALARMRCTRLHFSSSDLSLVFEPAGSRANQYRTDPASVQCGRIGISVSVLDSGEMRGRTIKLYVSTT